MTTTIAPLEVRCWKCVRLMFEHFAGDVRLKIICRRCGAPNEVTIEGGALVEGPRHPPGLPHPSNGGTAL